MVVVGGRELFSHVLISVSSLRSELFGKIEGAVEESQFLGERRNFERIIGEYESELKT